MTGARADDEAVTGSDGDRAGNASRFGPRTFGVAGALTIVPLLLFAPVLFGRVVALRDFPSWTWPSRALWRAAVLEGRLPQWNPYVGLGAPIAAAPVHGLFYPPNVILLLAPPLLALGLLWIAHVVFAGAGGYRLARRLGCRPTVALASAFVWQVGGYAVSMWGDGEKVLTGAFVPWVALGLVHGCTARRPARALAGTSLALGLMALAGDPFLWLHALLLGAAPAWAMCADEIGGRRAALRLAARSGIAGAGGLVVGAASLLPAFALLEGSDRVGGLARAAAERWSLAPARIAALFAPIADAQEWAPALYIGGLAALGALLVRFDRRTRALGAVAFGGLLLALGGHTPVNQIARTLLPPLAYLRYPEKHVLVTIGALALLGALGIERALTRRPLDEAPPEGGAPHGDRSAGDRRAPGSRGQTTGEWELGGRRIALAAAVGIALAAAGRAWPASAHGAIAVSAFAGLLALARRVPRAQPLLPLVAALELLLAAFPLVDWTDGARLTTPPAAIAGALVDRDRPPPRLYHARAAGGDPSSLPDNVGAPWGLAHVPGHESGQSGRLRRLWEALSGRGARVVDLLDVRWLALPPGPPPAGAVAVGPLGEAQLDRLPDGHRIRLVSRARVLDDPGALAVLAGGAFDPDAEALLAPGSAPVPLAPASGACAYRHFAPERIEVACDVRGGPALLVLAEGYARGWSATIDGRPAPILRADFALRAVPVSQGVHTLVMRYRTPLLPLGLALSLCDLLASLAVVVGASRERSPKVT